MSPIAPANTVALLMPRQAQQPTQLAQRAVNRPGGNDLLAASNGANGAAGGPGKPMADAQARINEAMFDVGAVNVTAMKVKLIERVGKELGVDHKDYDNERAYGAAIRDAFTRIRNEPNSALVITAIEKNLGLDKLGVSLETVVNAVFDPRGDDADRLDAALRRQAGEDGGGKHDAAAAAYQAW